MKGPTRLRDSKAQSDILVGYFLRDVVQEFDHQYRKAYENKTPLKIAELRETAGDWTVIALDSSFPWPPSEISGHYLIYHASLPKARDLDRDQKKKLEDQMTKLEAKLGKLDSTAKEEVRKNIIFRTESKYATNSVQWKIA